MKKLISLALILLMSVVLLAACSANKDAPAHQSQIEKDEGYYYYESILLDKDEVTKVFKEMNPDFPSFDVCPPEFHVTTEFMPSEKHNELYGTKVNVHIIGYTSGTVHDDADDVTSQNEGFIVELSADNEDMQKYLDSLDKTWHVTGSYTAGGKYTENLDWSKAKAMDVTLTGTFGGADSNEEFYMTPDSIKQ